MGSFDFQQDTTDTFVDGVHRLPRTGIDILIVGGGIGGLTMALEAWRQGHDVRVLEKAPGLEVVGDVVSLAPSALATLRFFPTMKEQFERESYDVLFSLWELKGHKVLELGEAEWNKAEHGHAAKNVNVPRIQKRSSIANMLEGQCRRLGIPILYGKAATHYDEDETKAMVQTVEGETFHADVVVAADGVATKSHKHVTGKQWKATSSGFGVFRVMIPIEVINEGLSPDMKAKFLSPRGEFRIYTAPFANMHFIIIPTRDFFCYVLTHKDNGGSEESWHHTSSKEAVLETLNEYPGWDPDLLKIISLTPDDAVLDWKLLWRDPQPQWTSKGGRVVQLGDSAHAFLPTSGNGATQAMEDGLSLATCLRIGAKKNIPLSTKAHAKLRFERVSTLQRMGIANRQELNIQDMEALEKDNSKFKLRMGKWIWGHDACEYAQDKYELAVKAVKEGTALENTNLPPGHVYEAWTIRKEMEDAKAGKPSTLWDTGVWHEPLV